MMLSIKDDSNELSIHPVMTHYDHDSSSELVGSKSYFDQFTVNSHSPSYINGLPIIYLVSLTLKVATTWIILLLQHNNIGGELCVREFTNFQTHCTCSSVCDIEILADNDVRPSSKI